MIQFCIGKTLATILYLKIMLIGSDDYGTGVLVLLCSLILDEIVKKSTVRSDGVFNYIFSYGPIKSTQL